MRRQNMNVNVIKIKTIDSGYAGKLSFFEGSKDIPFDIKRIYYIHGVPNRSERGGHAHKKLKQILFCPYGEIEIILDNGKERASVMLDDPSKGLLVEHSLWREMVWHIDNSVLCVAASEYYDENDYIRNYEDFLGYILSDEGKQNG